MHVAGWSDGEFDAFVLARLAGLVRFAYALTGDLGHAEDVVQTALEKTYLATRRRVPDDPEAYVRRAVVTANLSRFRRRRVVEDLIDVVPDVPGGRVDGSGLEQRESVAALLADLTPRQRTVMVLRYQEDWSEAQIASAMGVSTGTVKTLASRALTSLRASTTATTEQRTGS
jgi:RNA polymerase sigma-70 factor (sigma-E family)